MPATPTPRRSGPCRVGIEFRRFARAQPSTRPQRLEARANAHAFAENLPGDGGSVIVERIQNAKLQTVHADFVGEIVIKLLLRDRRLRHAESAKSSRRNDVGVYRAS